MAHTQMVHDDEKCCLHMGKFLMLILILNQFSFGECLALASGVEWTG